MSGIVATRPRPARSSDSAEATTSRLSTPARLRIWTVALTVAAVALLAVTSTGIVRISHQVTAIGNHDAPQAATASDLYFVLSDLDAETASLLMLGNSSTLSINELDSLRTFEQRQAEVDVDLQQAELATTSATERAELSRFAAALTLYRQWVSMALTVEQQSADQVAGQPPSSSLGYYAEASTVLRAQLLPLAASLRQTNASDLDESFSAERTTSNLAIVATLIVGVALLVALVLFQRRLARTHRRILNPSLVLATLATAALVVGCCVLFGSETSTLRQAQNDEIRPYLALTQAQAVTYDASGDASRYLIESDPHLVATDFAAKAACLRSGGSCGSSTTLPSGGLASISGRTDVVQLWDAYAADFAHVVSLSDSGQRGAAISVITGLSAGDGAIDLYRYNRTVDEITVAERSAYTQQLLNAQRTLRFWPEIPAAAMILTIALIGLGVRPRLAEYR